jgi:hypothetical protein
LKIFFLLIFSSSIQRNDIYYDFFSRSKRDSLVETQDQKTSGRKQYQYVDCDGKRGRIVSRKEHILELKAQGKLIHVNVEEFTFSSKRKRSSARIDVQEQSDLTGSSTIGNTTLPKNPELLVRTEVECQKAKDVNFPEKKAVEGDGLDDDQLPGHADCGDDDDDLSGNADTSVRRSTAVTERPALLLKPGQAEDVSINNVEDSNRMNQNEVEKLFGCKSVKLRNEQIKKKQAMESLKLSSQSSDLSEVCRVMDQFRARTISNNSTVVDQELKLKLIDLLTTESPAMEDLQEVLATTDTMKEFFLDEIFQETLTFATRKTVLKVFPPELRENNFLTLLGEAQRFAPNLLSLLLKLCTKPNEPISEKQSRKIIFLISQMLANLNQKNSLMQKLVALKLKLAGVTNSGLDFLADLGITQSSRSLQKDHDYLASLSQDHLVEELKNKRFNFLVDNLDKMLDGNLVHFTSVIVVAEPMPHSDLSSKLDGSKSEDFFKPEYMKLDQESEKKYLSAILHILGHLLLKICPSFGWIENVIPMEFKHTMSEFSDQQSFWSYLSLLPLSEQKNSDMVDILSFLNEFTLG